MLLTKTIWEVAKATARWRVNRVQRMLIPPARDVQARHGDREAIQLGSLATWVSKEPQGAVCKNWKVVWEEGDDFKDVLWEGQQKKLVTLGEWGSTKPQSQKGNHTHSFH